MPVPHLPNELIDQILRYRCLDDDDLIQACLVSRSWLEPARKSLWAEVCIELIEEKVIADGNPYPRRTTHRHHSGSWKIISILSQSPELASYVKHIELASWNSSAFDLSLESNFSTSMPDLTSSLLRLCPAATSFAFEDDIWLDLDYLGSYYAYFGRFRTLRLYDSSASRWHEMVKQLPNLRSLSLAFEPEGTKIKGLKELHLEGPCDTEAFKILSLGSKTSLRSLRIPLNALAVLDLSQYPNLRRLAINKYGDAPSVGKTMSFLEQLESSNLEVIHFSTEAAQHFSKFTKPRSSIPHPCRRVNLDMCWTLDTVVAVIPGPRQDDAGGQIAQLGVPRADIDRDFPEIAVVGLKAIVEHAGVDLIWT